MHPWAAFATLIQMRRREKNTATLTCDDFDPSSTHTQNTQNARNSITASTISTARSSLRGLTSRRTSRACRRAGRASMTCTGCVSFAGRFCGNAAKASPQCFSSFKCGTSLSYTFSISAKLKQLQTPHSAGRTGRTRHRHWRSKLRQIRVYRRAPDQPHRERGLELRDVLHGEEGAVNRGVEGGVAANSAPSPHWLTFLSLYLLFFHSPQARDHARQLLEKHVRKPFFETTTYAQGRERMSLSEVEAGLAWLSDRFYVVRYEDEELPSIDWVLDVARSAVMR